MPSRTNESKRSATCKVLEKSIQGAKSVHIVLSAKGLNKKNKKELQWYASKSGKLNKILVKPKNITKYGACRAFKKAFTGATGVDFEQFSDKDIFHSSKWRKYTLPSKDVIFVFVVSPIEYKLVAQLGANFVKDPVDSELNGVVKKASGGSWWQRHWKPILIAGIFFLTALFMLLKKRQAGERAKIRQEPKYPPEPGEAYTV